MTVIGGRLSHLAGENVIALELIDFSDSNSHLQSRQTGNAIQNDSSAGEPLENDPALDFFHQKSWNSSTTNGKSPLVVYIFSDSQWVRIDLFTTIQGGRPMAKAPAKKKKKAQVVDPVPDLASAVIKKYAAKQKIRIQLTPDQMDAILAKWNDRNPKMPAEITFYAGKREIVNLKVAAYRYRGDTCCA